MCSKDHVDIRLADFGSATLPVGDFSCAYAADMRQVICCYRRCNCVWQGDKGSNEFKNVRGTEMFMAPEVRETRPSGGYSCAVDMWSAVREPLLGYLSW